MRLTQTYDETFKAEAEAQNNIFGSQQKIWKALQRFLEKRRP